VGDARPPMSMLDQGLDIPGPDEVRSALERIVASEALRASPQLAMFLSFVVETELRGESNRIKAYTIAVEALGRPPSFDPEADSIVRVMAGRLRRALEQYYAEDGADEDIVVDLPRGTYIPVFRRRTAAQAPLAAAEPRRLAAGLARRPPARWGWIPLAAIGVAAAAAIGLVALWPRDHGAAPAPASFARGLQPFRAARAAPVLFVQPFEAIGAPTGQAFAINRLRSKISDAMARFDGLNVITELAPSPSAGDPSEWSEYHFTGSAEYHADGATTLSFRLVDAADGTIIWSRLFDSLPAGGDPGAAEDKVVREIASTVAGPFGIIWAREVAAHSARDPRRACLIEVIEYWRKFNPVQHEGVRQCLERMVAEDPNYAQGYSGLALVYLRDFYLDIVHPGEPPALDRALQFALHAAELKPDSARSLEILFVVWFTRGEMDQAFAAADRAIAANPYDTNLLAEYGARLVAMGQLDRGMAMLNEAATHTLSRPAWFDFHLFIGAYLQGNLASASQHAAVIENDRSLFGLLARALAAKARGEDDKAKQAVDRLVALNPGWRVAPRRQLAKFFPSGDVQDRLLRDLETAGLRTTN
jgi:TolB-like protein